MRRDGAGEVVSPNVEFAHSMNSSGTATVLSREENPTIRAGIHCCFPLPLTDIFNGTIPIIASLSCGSPRDDAKPKLYSER